MLRILRVSVCLMLCLTAFHDSDAGRRRRRIRPRCVPQSWCPPACPAPHAAPCVPYSNPQTCPVLDYGQFSGSDHLLYALYYSEDCNTFPEDTWIVGPPDLAEMCDHPNCIDHLYSHSPAPSAAQPLGAEPPAEVQWPPENYSVPTPAGAKLDRVAVLNIRLPRGAMKKVELEHMDVPFGRNQGETKALRFGFETSKPATEEETYPATPLNSHNGRHRLPRHAYAIRYNNERYILVLNR